MQPIHSLRGQAALRCALGISILGLLSCAEGTYEVRLQVQPALLEAAALVEVAVIPNCESATVSGTLTGDPLLRYNPDSQPPALGNVPVGTHGLVARLVNMDCEVIASGCVTISLDEGASGVLTVPLSASVGQACSSDTTCGAGRCLPPMPDGGVGQDTVQLDAQADAARRDVMSVDASDVDARAADSGVDADMADTGCECPGGTCRLGVCCTGCWAGGECVGGDVPSQCGAGGNECVSCDCPTPSCSTGVCADAPFRMVDMGSSHACYITSTGAMYCAGRNHRGQLGNGGISPREVVPQRVDGEWSSVAIGSTHTCAIQADGGLFCWGDSERGQAGQDGGIITEPRLVMPGTFDRVSSNGASGSSFARRADGVWFGFGENLGGGIDPTDPGSAVRVPTPVFTVDGNWVQVSTAIRHTCGLTAAGEAYCWGDNERGQLGSADVGEKGPIQVSAGVRITDVFAGLDVSCVQTRESLVLCTGVNTNRVLGRQTAEAFTTSFVATNGLGLLPERITGDHSSLCAVDASGAVVCWGSNTRGELGFGHTDFIFNPTRTPHFDNAYFDIGRSASYGYIDGRNRVWGINSFDAAALYLGQGRLGLGDTLDVVEPTALCIAE